MEYNNQLSENDKRFADEFSNYVNGKMASPRKVGKALADDHRYLVNEKAKLMFYFMEQLAENWHKGRYDQRNEWACRLATTIFSVSCPKRRIGHRKKFTISR